MIYYNGMFNYMEISDIYEMQYSLLVASIISGVVEFHSHSIDIYEGLIGFILLNNFNTNLCVSFCMLSSYHLL